MTLTAKSDQMYVVFSTHNELQTTKNKKDGDSNNSYLEQYTERLPEGKFFGFENVKIYE